MQAEMIAVEVLSHTVTNNAVNSGFPLTETPQSAISTDDASGVIGLIQDQIASGSQMYSLQINGQTIPFTTVQLPLMQATNQDEISSATNAETLSVEEGMAASMVGLQDSGSASQLPCTPVRNSMVNIDGKCPISYCIHPPSHSMILLY